MHNLNTELFFMLHRFSGQSSVADAFVVALTSWVAVVVILLVGIYLTLWLPYREKDIYIRTKVFLQALSVIALTSVTWGIGWVIKFVANVPRPFHTIETIVPLVGALDPSFPSAHAVLTMAIATAVGLYHKKLGALLTVFAILVALSRIYVGVHYPFDICAGLLLGYLIPTLLYRVFKK